MGKGGGCDDDDDDDDFDFPNWVGDLPCPWLMTFLVVGDFPAVLETVQFSP